MMSGFGLNLKLRWKFFIILLVFSLTPLIVVIVVSQRGTLHLGKTISEDARVRLTHIIGMELRQTAENSAKVLQRTKDAMAFYLQVLAGEAELAFSKMSAAESPKIYFAADFDDPRTAPEDFLPIQRSFSKRRFRLHRPKPEDKTPWRLWFAAKLLLNFQRFAATPSQ